MTLKHEKYVQVCRALNLHVYTSVMHSDSFNLVLLWIEYLKISTSFLCNLCVDDLTINAINPMKPPHNKQIQMNDINRKLICSRGFTKRAPCQIKNIALLRRRKFKIISFVFFILNWYINTLIFICNLYVCLSLSLLLNKMLESIVNCNLGCTWMSNDKKT